MKISACWITKNESKNILRSIEGLKTVVDELVIVDTGSTDDTVDIATAAGARVEHFEWIGDFSAARNYTMSKVTGEIMFFIDADEWFEPKLTLEDRKGIEEIFLSHPDIDAIQIISRNLNDQGVVRTTDSRCKIIRNDKKVEFKGKIHEQLRKLDGSLPESVMTNSWQLNHSGHAEGVIQNKMERNIELLEESAKNSPDPLERHLHHCYLVREYYCVGKTDDSLRHLKLALEEPELIRRQCGIYEHGFASLMYNMLFAAADADIRRHMSRREVYRKLVEPFCRYIRLYPGLATIELFYKSLFDLKEDVLLSRIKPAMEAARAIPDSPVSNYCEAEMIINQFAAEAAFRRGKLTEAMNYAVESFKYPGKNPVPLHVLLSCMRGIPAEEIIFFLNSQFDLNNPARLEYLSAGTRMHGFKEIHAYYLEKRIRAGSATKGDYLYLLLLYGRYDESVKASRELYSAEMADACNKNLFLAAICAEDRQIYRDNADYLKGYGNILDAYFGEGATGDFTDNDFKVFEDSYGLIALAAGMEIADKFMGLFKARALLCFQVRARYCVQNGLYEAVPGMDMPDPGDATGSHYVIEALTATGRCEEAVDKIEEFFGAGYVDEVLLKFLLAAADRSTGELKRRAGALYEKYSRQYDLLIDMRDILNTGYVVDEGDKKKARAYKSLTPAQFKKQLAEDAGKPRINGLGEIIEQVGAVYEGKGMPAAATECYRLSLAEGHNADGNREKLAGLFGKMGNNQLAAAIKAMK